VRPDWPSWRVSPVPNRPFCDGYHIGGSGCAACSVYNADTVPFFFVQPEAPTIVKSSRLNSNSEQYRAHAADCRQRAKEACILEVKYRLEEVAMHLLHLADEVEAADP